MERYKVYYEEKVTVLREYEIEVENEEELLDIMNNMDKAGDFGRPSEYIPDSNLVSYTDETDFSSPVFVEYEYHDHELI